MDDTSTFAKEMLSNFLKDMNYIPTSPLPETNRIYQTLLREFSIYDISTKDLKDMCNVASLMAELPYALHSDHERLLIARVTWYAMYIDDLGHNFPLYLEGFQRRTLDMVTGNDQHTVVLTTFRDLLSDFYRLWEPLTADCIIIATMEFITGCLLEHMSHNRSIQISEDASSWPYFLRRKTGYSPAFAYMIFPKSLKVDIGVYIQVIEDITLYLNLGNDLLSYYKEEITGEKNTYVHTRAYVTKKSSREVIMEMYNEVVAVHQRISQILEPTEAFIPWKRFANGYIGFHILSPRYRFTELELASPSVIKAAL